MSSCIVSGVSCCVICSGVGAGGGAGVDTTGLFRNGPADGGTDGGGGTGEGEGAGEGAGGLLALTIK